MKNEKNNRSFSCFCRNDWISVKIVKWKWQVTLANQIPYLNIKYMTAWSYIVTIYLAWIWIADYVSNVAFSVVIKRESKSNMLSLSINGQWIAKKKRFDFFPGSQVRIYNQEKVVKLRDFFNNLTSWRIGCNNILSFYLDFTFMPLCNIQFKKNN